MFPSSSSTSFHLCSPLFPSGSFSFYVCSFLSLRFLLSCLLFCVFFLKNAPSVPSKNKLSPAMSTLVRPPFFFLFFSMLFFPFVLCFSSTFLCFRSLFFSKSSLKIFSHSPLLKIFLPHWFCDLPPVFIRCRGRGSSYSVQVQGLVARAWVSYFFHNGGRLWLCQGRERRREKIFKIFLLPCLCTRRGRRKTILFKTTMFQVFLFFLIFLIIFFVFLKEKKMNLGVT